ncbi:MAG: LPS-assembly protein LptD [Rhodobacteraceae bacterium]|nr:LPS-assembly protein LptD [Paracoccaceae bacterium]
MLSILLALPAWAQQAEPQARASDLVLTADQVVITAQDTLIARGNVEALLGQRRLRTQQITYDNRTGRLTIDGPLRLEDGAKRLVLADSAELERDLYLGILRGVQLLMDQRLQLASHHLQRIDGRYNVFGKTALTSCQVCQTNRPPLWQIRVRRVVHDQQKQQIHLEHARLYLWDLPIFYLPYMRLPDPSQDRATGFLIPRLSNDTLLGPGVHIPYFITIGAHRDLTLLPYLSTRSRTLGLRYRQAFRQGYTEVNTSVSDDTLTQRPLRSYLFLRGQFHLPSDYTTRFDLKAVSDDAYLVDYGLSDADRLESSLTTGRSRRDHNTQWALIHYNSLRSDEDNRTLPSVIAMAHTEHRLFPAAIGGELQLGLGAHGHYRRASLATDGPDSDRLVDGRDVFRVNGTLSWGRTWQLPMGLRLGVLGESAVDAIKTRQDATRDELATQITFGVAMKLHWPLRRVATDGSIDMLEPLVQVGWISGETLNIANDESAEVEWDEGNLLALSRFPSVDRRERGALTALGLRYSHFAAAGGSRHLTLGQIYRREPNPDLTPGSGLEGQRSDLLVAGQIKTPNGLFLGARALLDESNGFSRAALHMGWNGAPVSLDASYIWLDQDPARKRPDALSEYAFHARYGFARHWSTTANWRYDAEDHKTIRAGLGLEYLNECVKVDFSISRRFTTSATLRPATHLRLVVSLLGFSAGQGPARHAHACRATP